MNTEASDWLDSMPDVSASAGTSARDGHNIHALLVDAAEALASGRAEEAVRLGVRAVRADPTSFAAVRTLSGLLDASGRRSYAIKAGYRAIDLDSVDPEARMHLGCLLACERRWTEAVRHLAVHVDSPGATPAGWRVMSTALHESGRTAKALDAISRAIEGEPLNVEFRLHKASLLGVRGRFGDSLAELSEAASIDPHDARVWHASSAIHHVLGDAGSALSDARRASDLAPGDADIAAHFARVGGRLAIAPGRARSMVLASEERWLARRPPRPEIPKARRTPADMLSERWRVIWALMLREMRTRHARSRLGYLWAMVEPLTHLLTLGSVFAMMNHSPPPVGDSLFLFYLTGLLPFLMFSHVSSEISSCISANGAVLQLPVVRRMDTVWARSLLHLSTETCVAVVVFACAAALGVQGFPVDILTVGAATGLLWALATGIGMVNMVMSELAPTWDTFWQSGLRVLYFASGIYYSPMSMPGPIREALAWNPVLQGVELFRSGFFRQYDPHWVDPGYLAACAAAALGLGLLAERAFPRHRTAA